MLFLVSLVLLGKDIFFEESTKYKIELKLFSDFAIVDRVVKLQSVEGCLIGQIDKAIYNDKTNTVIVADIKSTHAVYTFDDRGNFIGKLAAEGNGPGEINGGIRDIALLKSGKIAVLSSTSIGIYGQDGEFIKSVHLEPFTGFEMAAAGDYFYVEATNAFKYSSIDGFKKTKMSRVARFDSQGNLLNRFGKDDPRRVVYNLVPRETLQAWRDEVWIFNQYEPIISVYDLSGRLRRRYIFKQWNKEKLDDLWSQKNFTEKTFKEIRNNMHRFELMYPFGDCMLVFDQQILPRFNMRMFTFHSDGSLRYYSGYNPINPAFKDETLVFTWFVGSYNDGIIASMEPDAFLNADKTNYPKLKSISVKDDDNPLLIFVKPKRARQVK